MPTSLANLTYNISRYTYKSTELDNLPFGPDRKDGGTSKEPYIKKPLNLSGTLGNVAQKPVNAATDVLRMTKFLVDLPKGPLFLAKQVGLQLTNPEMQSSDTSKSTGLLSGIQNKLGSNRIFTPINFLAQIAGSAAGLHIPRHGTKLQVPEDQKYQNIVKRIEDYRPTDNIRSTEKGDQNRIVNLVTQIAMNGKLEEGPKELFHYSGGPDSYLGLGKTTIKSYYSTFAATYAAISNNDEPKRFIPIAPTLVRQFSVGQLANQDFREYKYNGDNSTYKRVVDKINNDYKEKVNPTEDSKIIVPERIRITDYSKQNTTSRIGIINTNQKSFQFKANDAVNMTSLYYSADPNPEKGKKDINGNPINNRDLISFRIKAIDNDKPSHGVYMIFRAFLNQDVQNNMEATWNAIKYAGRGESFYSYEGFTESYSLGFTIVAFSAEEMRPLYQKLNYLKSTFAPDYKANKMRGNMIEMTVGDYLKQQPGILNSISITIPEDASWEIAMNEPDADGNPSDKKMHVLPHVLRVTLNFTPVYNFLPKKSSEAPFIGIDDSEAKATGSLSLADAKAQAFKFGKEWIYGTNDKLKA